MSRVNDLAEILDRRDPLDRNCHIAAALLRQQDEMITLQGKVLRQCVEALEDAHYRIEHLQDVTKRKAALAAAKECLK